MRTLFDSMYVKVLEVEGLPISYGHIKETNIYLTYNYGDINLHPSKEKALESYRNILKHKLSDIKTSMDYNDVPY